MQEIPKDVDKGGSDVDVPAELLWLRVKMLVTSVTVLVTVETAGPVKGEAQQNVESHSSRGHDQHGGVVDLEVLVVDPPHGEVDQDPGDVPDHAERGQGSESLGPVVAEGHGLGWFLVTDPENEERHSEAGEVTEHVSGVCHDGQGPTEVPAYYLPQHEYCTQDSRYAQLLSCLDRRVPPGTPQLTVGHLQVEVEVGVLAGGELEGGGGGREEERSLVTVIVLLIS